VFLGAGTIAVLALAGSLLAAGELTWGGLVAFLAYQWRFQGPLRGIAALVMRLARARVALARVLEIADLPATLAPGGLAIPTAAARGDLVLAGVTFRYPGEPGTQLALAGLGAQLTGGTITAIVGPSGSGKSTLLRLLLRLAEPESGTILVGGNDLARLDGDAWREHVAVVSQDTFLFHDTIRENVCLARPVATDEQIEAAIRASGLGGLVDRLPEGLATVVGERGMRLSGGERQRVSLARALLRDPPLLILDEATAALDPLTEDAVWHTLCARRDRGRGTTLVVTHRIGTAMRADHAIVLEAGRAVQAGPPAQLARQGGSFAELLAAWSRVPA
jgi:ABC-type multidrug transport system fused ATPase/permease subunit